MQLLNWYYGRTWPFGGLKHVRHGDIHYDLQNQKLRQDLTLRGTETIIYHFEVIDVDYTLRQDLTLRGTETRNGLMSSWVRSCWNKPILPPRWGFNPHERSCTMPSFSDNNLGQQRPDSIREITLPRDEYFHSPADWRNEVLYFLLPDRFSDG